MSAVAVAPPFAAPAAPRDSLPPAFLYAAIARCDRSELEPVLRATPVPRTVLALGPAAPEMARALRVAGIATTTLARDPDREPDIIAPIDSIPAEPGQWDIAVCGPGFERLALDRFAPALRELHRVVGRSLVLSLPERSSPTWLPAILSRRPVAQPTTTRWMLGERSTPLHAVTAIMEVAGWRVEDTWTIKATDRSAPRRGFVLHRVPEAA
ncbi:MAG: hypothetical protein AB8G96_01695 [Phycisphaerales bacterium]